VDSIRNHYQLIVTHWNRTPHVEVRVMELLSCGYGHCRMVERPAEKDFFATNVFESNQGIVRGHLRVIAVAICLRQAI
jgi:hypothetical protein